MSVIHLVLILAGAQAIRLIDEDDSWLDHDDPPHSYATGMWWRLANYTLKTSDMKRSLLCMHWCCTYVPDNDTDGHLIDHGIKTSPRQLSR